MGVEDAYQLAVGDLTGDSIPEFVVGGEVNEPDLPSIAPRWKFQVLPLHSETIDQYGHKKFYRIGGMGIVLQSVMWMRM